MKILSELNNFNAGKWLVFPTVSTFSDVDKEKECLKVVKLFENTAICLNKPDTAMKLLKKSTLIVFVDNAGKPQIVGDISCGYLEHFRGTVDGVEQNISSEFLPVANEFLNNNLQLIHAKSWLYQINWIDRLKNYMKLFNEKRYKEIDVESLINDLAYNGYSLHYKDCSTKERLYYPLVKRELIHQPMLKPLIAKHLHCKTEEIYIGKYQGNGKGIKYIIGDCLSNFIVKDSCLKKVFGSIKIKSYQGEFDVLKLSVTMDTEIFYQNGFNSNFLSLSKCQAMKSEQDFFEHRTK